MNLIALFELVPAALIGTVVWWLSGKHDAAAMVCCGVLLLAADLALRWRRRPQVGAGGQWLHAAGAGGVVSVFPVWTVGLVQLGVGVARSLGVTM